MEQRIWASEDQSIEATKTAQFGSAKITISRSQQAMAFMFIFALGILSLIYGILDVVVAIIAFITFVYLLTFLYKAYLAFISGGELDYQFSSDEIASLDEKFLPKWSVLVPLYHEEKAIPSLITSLSGLDYPKDKLEILILVRAEDDVTNKALAEYELPSNFYIINFGDHYPKTKPKALNFGLTLVDGEYLVIYDAECRPDPQQLKKAWLAFLKSDPDVVGVISQTLVRNTGTNWLTKNFAAEYSFHHPWIESGLARTNAPIPAPGNSLHFRTAAIREIGGWDPFNMTEDCDLGICIARKNWRMVTIESATYEEAPFQIWPWIKQRTRWNKGFMQSWLVHMRNPLKLLYELGPLRFLQFNLTVGASILVLLFNPIFWIMTATYLVTRWQLLESLYPSPVLSMGLVTTVIGGLLFVHFSQMGSIRTGVSGNVKWMLLAPFFYWTLMSIAGWRAFIQLLRNPHQWELTAHGLVPETEGQQHEISPALVRLEAKDD